MLPFCRAIGNVLTKQQICSILKKKLYFGYLKLLEKSEFFEKRTFYKNIPLGLAIIVKQFFKARSLCLDSYYHAFLTESKIC